MDFKIYNHLSRKKELFEPLEKNKVKMYCCGPTVYGLLHVGNFRGSVFYNLLKNWLEHLGYQVTYSYNFTDVDDKILKRAAEENKSPREIAEFYIKEFKKDFEALKLASHDLNPRVTETMDEIISMITRLIEKKKAYAVDGDVFFSVESLSDYGKLSGRKTDELKAGARVAVDDSKQSPLDFALWKKAKPGEESWPSPWGEGRPGWHIECSAMNSKHFGEQIDIHGGGLDLLFPHHENERAQSVGLHGHEYAKYWCQHNLFTLGGAKMSKSVGNLITMREFLDRYPAEVYKFLVLSSHYRSEVEFSEKSLKNSIVGLERIYDSLQSAEEAQVNPKNHKDEKLVLDFQNELKNLDQSIHEHLSDDVNSSLMMSELFKAVRLFNRSVQSLKKNQTLSDIAKSYQNFILKWGKLSSLFQEDAIAFLAEIQKFWIAENKIDSAEVELLIEKRKTAKAQKDFKLSDEIRNSLQAQGIEIQDTAQGTTWRAVALEKSGES